MIANLRTRRDLIDERNQAVDDALRLAEELAAERDEHAKTRAVVDALKPMLSSQNPDVYAALRDALAERDEAVRMLHAETAARIEAQRRHARAVNHPAAVLATGTLAERRALAAQIVHEPSPLRVDTDTCDPAGIVRPNVATLADRRLA